jgi:glucose-1-phosphate thymidylyltransferase
MGVAMSKTLGIILAGGKSTRLFPATLVSTKQILPIYDKPLVYYPLTTLMLSGIRDYVLISTPKEKKVFQELFHDAEEHLGIRMRFLEQAVPVGIADCFNIVNEALQGDHEYDSFALILGDNIFHGAALRAMMEESRERCARNNECIIFPTLVTDPKRFGVVEFDQFGTVISLEEKPEEPRSNYAITGLYLFPKDVLKRIKMLEPSERGELEITDLVATYLETGNLVAQKMLRGMLWFDTGTPDSMHEAATMIQLIQRHQGLMVGCPHEVAFQKEWVDSLDLREVAYLCEKSSYGQYLLKLVKSELS